MAERIKAIQTKYKGNLFRSKLEAQWAKLLDYTRIKWIYEPEGFVFNDGTAYLPDFYLPEIDCFLEIKGLMTDKDFSKIQKLSKETGRIVLIGSQDFSLSAIGLIVWEDEKGKVFDYNGESIIQVIRCPHCHRLTVLDYNGSWTCWRCDTYLGDSYEDILIDCASEDTYFGKILVGSKEFNELIQIDYRRKEG